LILVKAKYSPFLKSSQTPTFFKTRSMPRALINELYRWQCIFKAFDICIAPLERKILDVFSGIVCSFAHLPAVCKWMYGTYISNLRGGGFLKRRCNKLGLNKIYNFVLKFFWSIFVLYCATATLSRIWPNNVTWTWKHAPQLYQST
jgi:hypothetical protein